MLLSSLVYSSTLKMEAIRSSEKPFDFQRTTRVYFPDDRTSVKARTFRVTLLIPLVFCFLLTFPVSFIRFLIPPFLIPPFPSSTLFFCSSSCYYPPLHTCIF
jgi:hypothetical protein